MTVEQKLRSPLWMLEIELFGKIKINEARGKVKKVANYYSVVGHIKNDVGRWKAEVIRFIIFFSPQIK